jgi:hypothetical protein
MWLNLSNLPTKSSILQIYFHSCSGRIPIHVCFGMTFMPFIPWACSGTADPIEILTNPTFCDTFCMSLCNTWRPTMPALSLRLPEELDRRLGDEARLEELPRSEVVRIAIIDYLARRERERFMAELVAEAQTAYSDEAIRRTALELAEEGMSASNEALEIAEGRKTDGSNSAKTTEKWWK